MYILCDCVFSLESSDEYLLLKCGFWRKTIVKGTESPIYLLGVIKQIEEREEKRSECGVQRKVDV